MALHYTDFLCLERDSFSGTKPNICMGYAIANPSCNLFNLPTSIISNLTLRRGMATKLGLGAIAVYN